MTFVLQELDKKQFLSPVIETRAIQKLAEYMAEYYKEEPGPYDKPTCAVCFDMSGTGKTTTIMEASKKSNSIIAHISLIDNELFKPLLDSSENLASIQKPPLGPEDFISYSKVEEYFERQFESILAQLYISISEQLDLIQPGDTEINLSIPPTKRGPTGKSERTISSGTYSTLIEKSKKLNRLLVIHFDDCQRFFCGLTGTTRIIDVDGIRKVQVGKIMEFAYRLFVEKVISRSNILFIFSGTRPNLGLAMKVAGYFWGPFEIEKHLCDFDIDNVRQILQSYFLIDDLLSNDKLERLCGPPSLTSFFIQASQKLRNESKIRLESVNDLIQKWDEIESCAIDIYHDRIKSTMNRFRFDPNDLKYYVRNVCLLHTHGFIKNADGLLKFNDYPDSWLPFFEAGLIRVGRAGQLCLPNRFLLKIFERHVKWFTMKNVQDLVSAIKFSSSDYTTKGKIFEYLFAFELCSPTNSSLWKELGKLGLKPLTDWEPSVAKAEQIVLAVDRSKVYVIVDPDRSNSKIDVLFFANSISSNTQVRVLAQLKIPKKDSAQTIFQSMLAYVGKGFDFISTGLQRHVLGNSTSDFLLFVSPTSIVEFSPEQKSALRGSDCHWLDSSSLSSLLQFSLDLCDPDKIDDSLRTLTKLPLLLDYNTLSNWFNPSLKKRKREFDSMDDFYKALEAIVDWKKENTEKIKKVFEVQRIKLCQLTTLTDAKLKENGLSQRGLRMAVLAVIENV